MGVYNPNIPRVLGQEWVPIREEPIEFAPAINSVERGYSYTLTASRRIRDARFYLNQFPNPTVSTQLAMFNTYPLGTEALSGPIKQVTIPVSFASITGSGGTNWTIIGAPSLAAAWLRPDDNSYVQFTRLANVFSNYSVWFDVDKFPQLASKRILNVSLEYAGTAYDTGAIPSSGDATVHPPPQPLVNPDPTTPTTGINLNRYGTGRFFSQGAYQSLGSLAELDPPVPAPFGSTTSGATIHTLNLGDANFLFNGAFQTDYAPWTYDDLLFFNQGSGANRFEVQGLMQVPFTAFGNGTGGNINIFYFGLRVTYCEETRVMAGGRLFSYFGNTNIIAQRDLAKTADPVLAAGNYTTTLAFISPGDVGVFDSVFGNNPKVNGLREISAMPNQPGIEVDIPFPLDNGLGKTFTSETSHVLPQISLHTSGGVLTEIHPYGKQSQGQVYGVNFVTQEILDGAAGGAAQYPQVRFYARRFGNTTIPLTLASPTITGAGTTVSITPAAFDVLPEILDGWKQVNLRFTGTITMGTGANPQWFWTASGELPGNRWEVLGAFAPAISGGLGNPFNLAAQQLSSATYGQPSSGATINEGWIPQGGPYVTGAGTDDQTADATLIFSQDMPTVTGFTVSQANQPLSGIGLDCNAYPWYVPNSMSYNNLTWSPTSSSTPVSGFGYYEVQRMDTITTDWQTIAQMTTPGLSGFKDYEARVGIMSSYRIRAVNSLLFAGPWSSTVTGTLSAPGVTGTGMGANARTLLFTTNEVQSGASNLAYALAFESSDTTEEFKFPEAGFTQYQFMYGRDFQVAFRPLERGGETFSRTVLVQAAAISPPTLADFTSLRSLAWDDTSYVCVRDEDGNRWFANVTVPTGRVKMNNRELYLADINVIEVTETASVVEV